MGKAGQALKQVLEQYGISQYSLSVAMDVERNNVHRWVNEKRDPTAETVSRQLELNVRYQGCLNQSLCQPLYASL
jgi:plasmid maintenance system antidote protein VapI